MILSLKESLLRLVELRAAASALLTTIMVNRSSNPSTEISFSFKLLLSVLSKELLSVTKTGKPFDIPAMAFTRTSEC